MARDFSRNFYHSKAWEKTRNAYAASVPGGLCERCLKQGKYSKGRIVHHKIHLEPSNINDPSIALSFDNLELVCMQCHADEHPEVYQSRRKESGARVNFDAQGNVIKKESQ